VPTVAAKSSNVPKRAPGPRLSFLPCPAYGRQFAMSHSAPPRNGSTPTVLLVHGAFADGSMWAGVISELQAARIDVVAMASPLRGLTSDAAYVASAAAEIDGPILPAAHGTVVQRSSTTVGPAGVLVMQNRGGWDVEAPVDAGEDPGPVTVHVASQVRPDSNLPYRALLLSVNGTGSFTWFFMMGRSSTSKQLVRIKGRFGT